MNLLQPEQPRELWVLHKLDRAGHIVDHHHATAHTREALAAWEALGEPTAEYPHGRYRVERICPPPTLTEEVGRGDAS